MFQKYKLLWQYIKSDYGRYGTKVSTFLIIRDLLIFRYPCFVFSFWLRVSQVKTIFYPIGRLFHFLMYRFMGFQIPVSVKIGYGFFMAHGVGIVINSTVEIGDNCNLSQFVTIGSNGSQAAKIGNNVYIGPSVCIVEDVVIGDNVTVGAGAVVTRDIPDNATVAGVPARVLNYNNPGRYVIKRWAK